ncbi:unnamed protein product [Hymenolepis diminuta]|uniref:Cyclic nucleotide-binding domain-containing protein n=1 Tax=Hymenolepis diminuta TaxID=6216 RepID=A0A3P6ZXU0_HYMDI|nr:unnamed protein product [Hymenolepis diminuta]
MRIRTVHLPPGDTLIHAGGLLTTLYFVEQGSLEVLDPSDGAILAVLSKGDFFGGLPPLHQPQSLKNRGSRGSSPGMAPRSLVVAKSRFIVRALTYCDLHYVERDEFAALLLSYPEFVENLVSHFELTVPLAGSATISQSIFPTSLPITSTHIPSAGSRRCYQVTVTCDNNINIIPPPLAINHAPAKDLFCMNRDQKRQQSVSSPCIPPVYLHKDGAVGLMTRFSSSCIFTETPLLHVPPPPSQNPSRARLPESWLLPNRCRRSKLCSWELERLQRLLEHSTTGISDDEMVVPPGVDNAERDSSTSPTATTIATSTSHGDLEERLSAQMAQRFSKMELFSSAHFGIGMRFEVVCYVSSLPVKKSMWGD